MKIDWTFVAFLFGALFVSFPWIIGFVEIIYWFFAGHWAMFIPWDDERVLLALLWPWIWGFIWVE